MEEHLKRKEPRPLISAFQNQEENYQSPRKRVENSYSSSVHSYSGISSDNSVHKNTIFGNEKIHCSEHINLHKPSLISKKES